jgi:hypothetical protein
MSEGVVYSVEFFSSRLYDQLRLLKSKGYIGVYVTFRKKHTDIIPKLKLEGVDDVLFIIDALAKHTTLDEVFLLRSPRNLTELSILLTELLGEDDVKFVVLDTAQDVVFYNGFERTRKFFNMLTQYIKRKGKVLFVLKRKPVSQEERKFTMFLKTITDEEWSDEDGKLLHRSL